jgi:nucleotide-binding universal stress UspA family protein
VVKSFTRTKQRRANKEFDPDLVLLFSGKLMKHIVILFLVGIMFEKILIATDGSKHSERAAKIGVDLAKLSGGKVTALYVGQRHVAPIGGLTQHEMDEVVSGAWKAVQDEGNKATKYVEDLAKRSGVPVERKFIEGHPAEEILKVAEDTPMDVIVMGSIGKTGMNKFLLGSVADKVVRHSRVPVLVIPGE